jgi:hypothetical protein
VIWSLIAIKRIVALVKPAAALTRKCDIPAGF